MNFKHVMVGAILLILSLGVVLIFTLKTWIPENNPSNQLLIAANEQLLTEKNAEQNPPVQIAFETYSDDIITFDHPAFAEKILSEGDSSVYAVFAESASSVNPQLPFLKIYKKTVEEEDFTAYVTNYTNWTLENAKVFDARLVSPTEVFAGDIPDGAMRTEPRYALLTTATNGLQVLLEWRNYDSLLGNVYDMHVWLGDGTILLFTSEYLNHDVLNATYQSVRQSN